MQQIARTLAILTAGWSLATPALAASAGWQSFEIPATAAAPEIPVALYYPTQAAAQTVQMGVFTVHAALRATPDDKVKGLIVLSHGASGIELIGPGESAGVFKQIEFKDGKMETVGYR